jgi:hypothetical protein
MAFSVEIGERVTRQLAAMDDFRHELLLLEMLSLAKEPMDKGEQIDRDASVVRRILGVGSLGFLMYEVDEAAQHVRVVDVLWHG